MPRARCRVGKPSPSPSATLLVISDQRVREAATGVGTAARRMPGASVQGAASPIIAVEIVRRCVRGAAATRMSEGGRVGWGENERRRRLACSLPPRRREAMVRAWRSSSRSRPLPSDPIRSHFNRSITSSAVINEPVRPTSLHPPFMHSTIGCAQRRIKRRAA